MARFSRLPLVATTLLLAGCGQPAPSPRPTSRPTASGYVARVQALPPGQREGVLFRAIQSSGGDACQGIRQVASIPPATPGQPNWLVTCLEGSQWGVSLADDGTAYVTRARR